MSLSPERREAIAAWLIANDIDPADVPVNALIIEDHDTGTIRYTAIARENGRPQAPRPGDGQRIVHPAEPDPLCETREAPLLVPAPDRFPA